MIEDNSVRSHGSALLNARVGYRIRPDVRLELEAFNLAKRKASAVDYFYTSRLPAESAEGKADIHFHPTESRSFRAALVVNF